MNEFDRLSFCNLNAAIKREAETGEGGGKWETLWFPASLFSHPPHLFFWCRTSTQNHWRLFIHRDYYLNDIKWQMVTQQIQSLFQIIWFNYVPGFGCYSSQWVGPYCTFSHMLWDLVYSALVQYIGILSHSEQYSPPWATALNCIWSYIKT